MAPPPPEFDTSRVSPRDAIVTVQSLRRRFAEAFDQADHADDAAKRPVGGGLSAVEHAAATASALDVIGSSLHQVMSVENPRVELPSTGSPGPVAAGGDTAATALDRLGEIARSVADAMADIHGDAWLRTAQTAAGQVSALDMARLAVKIGVEHLRAAQRAISSGA
jgi:hypothetical protein